MTDVALYRKYRPSKFGDVISQSHVIEILESAIKSGNIVHAYLFSGSRGVGKTSIARIFAKELGVKQEDIYEIDAASNRGIDEIRELKDGVGTLPFYSKYKVYIIDEVHMLTTPAFNALLKTLEEPPSHVIFILATTELHKLPDTIISRCQAFSFKKPTDEDVKNHLKEIAKKEGYSIDVESLSVVSTIGEGSFRDAIGVLQKVFEVSSDKKIEISEVLKVTGAPKVELVNSFMEFVLNADAEKAISVIEKLVSQDIDIKIFIKLLMRSVRFSMLILYAPELQSKIKAEIGVKEFDILLGFSKGEKGKILPAVLKELLETYDEIDRAYIKSLPLELCAIKVVEKIKESQ